MLSLMLILRCLLIVALCFDTSVSQWSASAMAIMQVQRMGGTESHDSKVSIQGNTDCEKRGGSDETRSEAHHGYTCDLGWACCPCAFPIATFPLTTVFAVRRQVYVPSAPRSAASSPQRDSARLFRPPIG